MGTAGGLYHFRDQIARVFGSDTSSFFVLNSDVCCDFPLNEMIALNQETTNGMGFVIMGTKVCIYYCGDMGYVVCKPGKYGYIDNPWPQVYNFRPRFPITKRLCRGF